MTSATRQKPAVCLFNTGFRKFEGGSEPVQISSSHVSSASSPSSEHQIPQVSSSRQTLSDTQTSYAQARSGSRKYYQPLQRIAPENTKPPVRVNRGNNPKERKRYRYLCDFNDVEKNGDSPIFFGRMKQSVHSRTIPDWRNMDELLMYHFSGETNGTPLPSPLDINPGDVGMFDSEGRFTVLFNIFNDRRGKFPIQSAAPRHIKINQRWVGSNSLVHNILSTYEEPGPPPVKHFYLEGGRTRFWLSYRDGVRQCLEPYDAALNYVDDQAVEWYQHIDTSMSSPARFDLVLVASTLETPSYTYLTSCPSHPLNSDGGKPVLINIRIGERSDVVLHEDGRENHRIVHHVARQEPDSVQGGATRMLVAWFDPIAVPKPKKR